MEDDIEDCILDSAVFSRLKILSSFILSSSLNTSMSLMNRLVFRIEFVLICLFIVALLFTKKPENALELFTLKLKALYHHFVQKGNCVVNSYNQSAFTHWELKDQNVTAFGILGHRAKMEDRFAFLKDDENHIYLYGVFDGHGGESAAEFVKKELFPPLLERIKTIEHREESAGQSLLTEAIGEEILRIDQLLIENLKKKRDIAGTTALIAVKLKKVLLVANVGDSRGVLCDGKGMAIPASFDHKPHQTKEHKRIKDAGGFVSWSGVWRVAGMLATSRALGDYPLKAPRQLVIAQPDILSFNLADVQPKFLLLATDGLWDAFSNEEAIGYIRERFSQESDHGAASLARSAFHRGSLDNISVMVITFGY